MILPGVVPLAAEPVWSRHLHSDNRTCHLARQLYPAPAMRCCAVRAIDDDDMTGLQCGSRDGIFGGRVDWAIAMIESVRRDRVDQIILRNVHRSMPIAPGPGALARCWRTNQHY